MKKIVLPPLLVLYGIMAFCQPEPGKIHLFRCKIVFMQGTEATGVLYAVGDSIIELAGIRDIKQMKKPEERTLRTFKISEIQLMKFRKAGAIKTGLIAGGVTGFVAGALVGSTTDTSCEYGVDCFFSATEKLTNIIAGALVGCHIGAALGVLIASNNTIIRIDGNQQLYEQNRDRAISYQFHASP